jgi:hypothetical protein
MHTARSASTGNGAEHRSTKRRIASAVAALGMAAGLGLVVSAPAHADDGDCSYYDGTQVCAVGGSGGYNGEAYFPYGSSMVGHPVDFTLVCDNGWVEGDSGSFYPQAYRGYTYFWNVDPQGTCHVTVTDQATGTSYSSPDTYY